MFAFIRLACIFLWCVLPLTLPAQQPYMWHITDEEGLPSMTVYHVMQDSRGFMWFGTEAGVCRFDGRSFKPYPTPSAKARSGTSLYEDKFGNIWFRNFAKQLFKIEKEQVIELKVTEKATNLLSYIHTSQDSLLIMDWGNVYISHSQRILWRKMPIPATEANWDLHIDKENQLFLFSTAGVSYYKNGKFAIFDTTEKPKRFFIKQKQVYTFEDERNRLIIWSAGKTKTVLPYPFKEIKQQNIHSFYIDRQNNYWFCTSVGIFGYDKAGKALLAGKPLLPNIDVSHILQDREGSYWITTLKDGVYVMPQLEVLIYNAQNSTLPADAVNCLDIQNNRSLLLGFNNGTVGKFSAQHGLEFVYNAGQKQQVETIYYNTVHQRLYVSASKLYIFAQDKANALSEHNFGAIKRIDFLNQQDMVFAAGSDARIVCVFPDVAKTLPLDKGWHTPYIAENHVIVLQRKRNRSVWTDKDKQTFWLASIDGLFCYEKGKLAYEITDEKGKSIYGVSFAQTTDGTLWVGTIEQGLYSIKNKRVIRHFNQQTGLAGNFCRGLWAEGHIIWVNTGKGVQYLDTRTGEMRLFNRHDGLHTYDIADLRVVHDTLWVATPKGLLCVHKDSLKRNQTPPLIYIQAFKVFENEQKLNDTYTFSHDKNNFKIEFQGLAYRSRGEFQYKYRMVGLDTAWIYTNNSNNFARYPSLPVGEYEFQVKAVNEDGIESEGMAIIQIIILPPWWQTWWAMIGWFLLLVGSLWGVFWWRLRRIQARNTIEQALRSSQLATLKVQMNPHFIFNALNAIQEFIWLNEKRLANQFLGKFADLMRLTLDMSNENYVTLQDEIKVLRLYLELEAVRFETLVYEFMVSQDIETESIYIPSMLIQPYIENAIKHGLLHKAGRRELTVTITLNDNQDMILCTIQDNGIGRKRAGEIQQAHPRKHKSFATSANQKRLELLNYGRKKAIAIQIIDLQDSEGNATGTQVALQIPIQTS